MNAELLELLRAQLDEDERVANEMDELDSTARNGIESTAGYGALQLVDRFDRERLLRDVKAKRRIVERYEFVTSHGPAVDQIRALDMTTGAAAALADVLKLLALSYADSPGYREE